MNEIVKEEKEFNPNKDKAWYVLSSFSGYDFKVESDLRAKMLSQFPDLFDEVLIISQEEEYTAITPSGKEVKRKRVINLFPGYIYIRLVMTDEVWFAIRNTKFVSGIIGSHGGGAKPTPIPDEDMNRILQQNGREDLVVRLDVDYQPGDRVVIASGPFQGHIGRIDSFERTRNIVKLTLEKFENANIVVETDKIRKVGESEIINIG